MIERKTYLPLAAVAALGLALYGCGGGGGDGPATGGTTPDPEYTDGLTRGSPQVLANIIDGVANSSRQDDQVHTVDFWHTERDSSEFAAGVNHKRRYRTHAFAIVSHDESGQLHFNVAVHEDNPIQQANPWARDGRGIGTNHDVAALEGVTQSRTPVSGPALADWHVERLAKSYESGGSLDIFVATDAQVSDGLVDPFADEINAEYNIQLSGAPPLEDDKDFMIAWIDNGESIDGSLGDVAGTFSCANEIGCLFIDNRYAGTYYAARTGISFTPVGGMPEDVPWVEQGTLAAADYLVFGHWLFVPEDVTDIDAYEFGVFANGGDAFQVANLMALTGEARYSGDAAGVYYADGLSSSPNTGTFTADVILMADFKTGSEYGTVSGEVNGFQFDGDANSSVAALFPTALNLTADAFDDYGVAQGEQQNIFDRVWPTFANPHRGGWINGEIEGGSADDGSYMSGYWSGKFFGNGAASTDLPTSIGGAFSAYVWDNDQQSERGLTGSFGAPKK